MEGPLEENPEDRFAGRNRYLRRLPPEAYRGQAYVHWTMAIGERRTGWLHEPFHAGLREVVTHTMFRYALCCPVYCLMPDHMHLLFVGILEGSDQRNAVKFLRRHVNELVLRPAGFEFQQQPHDHVLLEEERQRDGFEKVAAYIQNNPVRGGLCEVPEEYPYTGCVVPGYPAVSLSLWQEDYWDRFWETYWRLVDEGVMRLVEEEIE